MDTTTHVKPHHITKTVTIEYLGTCPDCGSPEAIYTHRSNHEQELYYAYVTCPTCEYYEFLGYFGPDN